VKSSLKQKQKHEEKNTIERFCSTHISSSKIVKGITYLFDLDFFRHNHEYESQAGSPDPVGNLFCVDAMRYGNVSRFFNHSCNPNVAIYTVVRSGDNRVYDLAIFALRPIKPYEELCFDYKTKKGVAVKQTCYCGEKNCRGWLFGS
jgi:histone-lysine N-methyltransferase SUV39H